MAFERFMSAFGRRRDQGAPAAPPDAIDTPPPGPSETELEDAGTARALDRLRDDVRAAGRDLPTPISSRLRQIDDRLREIVAAIADQGASTEQRVLLAAMIGDYVPTPMRAYLALDDADRAEDAAATTAFGEQLGILEATVRDMLGQVRSGAIAELSTYGRFLADKFQGPDDALVLGGR